MGRIKCKHCQGFPHSKSEEHCYRCSGSGRLQNGKISCSSCGGRGKIVKTKICSWCNGTGYIEERSGGCFITTAVMSTLKKEDSCTELEAFRTFRDNYVSVNYPNDIAEYYNKAPLIVASINLHEDAEHIYQSLWEERIKISYEHLIKGRLEDAYQVYKMTMKELELLYLKVSES